MSDRPLDGFGIVVAGGSRGIGAAVAVKLAECGAGVLVNGRDATAVETTVEIRPFIVPQVYSGGAPLTFRASQTFPFTYLVPNEAT